MGRKTKVVRGWTPKDIQAPTLEEVIKEFSKKPEGYTARQLAEMFNRSDSWVRRKLIWNGYFEYAGESRFLDITKRPNVTFLYRITKKGKRELKTFLGL